jgi:hypothetical protein
VAGALVAFVGSPSAMAASPATGTISFGGTVPWSGGPLTGTAGGGPETGGARPLGCNPQTCDDFRLNVQVAPSADPGQRRFVDVSAVVSGPGQTLVFAYPPTATSLSDDWETSGTNEVRLLDPQPGVWRIRVFCLACAATSYAAKATTGGVPVLLSPLPPAGPLAFSLTRLPSSGGGEPGITVDRDGRIFVNSPFTGGGPTIFRSLDGGRSFTRKSHFDTVPIRNSFDSHVAIAPDDRTVYAVNRNGNATSFLVPFPNAQTTHNVYASRDRGRTYSGPFIIGPPGVDRPWLLAGPRGLVYLVQVHVGPDGDQTGPLIFLLRSTNHARTFAPRSNVTLSNRAGSDCPFMGLPALDPSDPRTIYIPYRDGVTSENGCESEREVWLAKSTDGGASWRHTKVTDGRGVVKKFVSVALDARNRAYVVWQEETASGESHIWMKSSTDGGRTFRGTTRVDQLASRHSNVFPSAAAADGRLDVAWYTSPARSYRDRGAAWTVALARSFDPASIRPRFEQSRVSPNVVHKGCVVGAPNPPCDALADFLDLYIDRDGLANLVWADSTGSKARAPYSTLNFYAKERPSASARRCLARRSPIGPRNIGRVRLRHTRRRLLRLRVKPVRRTRRSYRYCVKRSSGRVAAVFSSRSRRARVRLVTTTARGHGNRGVRARSKAARFRRAYPNRRRIGGGLYRAGPRSRRVFGVRRGRVRFIAVADRRLLRSRRALRRYVRLAGL